MSTLTKKKIQKRVLKNGKKLDLDLFSWDETTRTFSSKEDYLVLDFSDLDNCIFKTGSECAFKTGSYCTFKTGSYCTFKTSYNCTFKTSYNCTFKAGSYCIFKTSHNCVFDTGSNCIFNTGYNCIFNTGYNCTFKTGSECVVVRRYIFEVILLKEGIETIICPYNIKGFLEKIDGKFSYSEDTNKENEYIIEDNVLSRIK